MQKIGPFEISLLNFGHFRLDGGAMFGSVPKNLWAKKIPADPENCIRLATRCLALRSTDRCYLIDVGLGQKYNAKSRQIFGIDNISPWSSDIQPQDITDVILTHLHFDHAGGISFFRDNDPQKLELSFPNARVHLQVDNLVNARAPSLRERASYLNENVSVLDRADLVTYQGDCEIAPHIIVHQVNGHTRGQQWLEIEAGDTKLFYPTDLIPTAHHLPLPYHMGYDICAENLLGEKQLFLERAAAEKAIVIFEHDADTAAARIGILENGHYGIIERIEL